MHPAQTLLALLAIGAVGVSCAPVPDAAPAAAALSLDARSMPVYRPASNSRTFLTKAVESTKGKADAGTKHNAKTADTVAADVKGKADKAKRAPAGGAKPATAAAAAAAAGVNGNKSVSGAALVPKPVAPIAPAAAAAAAAAVAKRDAAPASPQLGKNPLAGGTGGGKKNAATAPVIGTVAAGTAAGAAVAAAAPAA